MKYDILTSPVFSGLEKISISAVKKLSDHHWFNRTLCSVNDSLVRIGVFKGEFHWHSHDLEDEFFLVLEGELEVELEGKPSVTLGPLEGVMVPKGVRHKPNAPKGATVLMVEQNSIVPTGSDEWRIFHNPHCSKSREALRLLEESGVKPTIIEYLQQPPSESDLERLILSSQESPKAFVRTKDEAFEAFKSIDVNTAASVAKLLHKVPHLLERPIVCKGDVVVIARPPEVVKALL